VHRRHLEGVVQNKIREQARDTLREHGLADSWRALEEHVVSTCRGYFAGPLGLRLTDDICQARSPTTSTGSTGGIGTPRRKAANWLIEAGREA
jgi:hypothetical protein